MIPSEFSDVSWIMVKRARSSVSGTVHASTPMLPGPVATMPFGPAHTHTHTHTHTHSIAKQREQFEQHLYVVVTSESPF